MAGPEVLILFAFFGVPLVTLVHELGHAGASLLSTDGPVEVYIGRLDCAVRLHAGRLRISLSPIGFGGLCRSPGAAMSREQLLVRALAGPGANAVLVLAGWFAGNHTTGGLRAALFTLAAISAFQFLNLVPRWGVWRPQNKNVPSDGLQALCLLRKRPLPPPPARAPARGLTDPIGRSDAAQVVAGLALGTLLVAHAIPHEALYAAIGIGLQVLLNTRGSKSKPAVPTATALSDSDAPPC
jgi:hypothetical protein